MICLVFRLHPPPSAIPNKGNEKNIVSIFKLFWLLSKINLVLSAHKYITCLLTANNKLWKAFTYAISILPRVYVERREYASASLNKQLKIQTLALYRFAWETSGCPGEMDFCISHWICMIIEPLPHEQPCTGNYD